MEIWSLKEVSSMSKESKTTPRGRDSTSGKFIPIEEARRRPHTTEVERIPKPGYGITDRSKKK